MSAPPRILPAGESAVVVEFGTAAKRVHHDRVLALDAAVNAALAAAPGAALLAGVTETVPTYRSLMVHFDPRAVTAEALGTVLAAMTTGAGEPGGTPRAPARQWRVPACYEDPHGEDLAEAAGLLGLAPERVAALHAEASYRVVMYGFAPGFVFLDGLPEALTLSRRATPRPPAKPGALTIANGQALIASIAMPTGWYVLGRTPARTYDGGRDPVFPLAVGDEVAFERVDAAGFDALAREAEAGGPVLRRVG